MSELTEAQRALLATRWTTGSLSGTSQTIAIADGNGIYDLSLDFYATVDLVADLRMNSDDTMTNYYSNGALTNNSGSVSGNAWTDQIKVAHALGTRRYTVDGTLHLKGGMATRTFSYRWSHSATDFTNESYFAHGIYKVNTGTITQVRLIVTTGSITSGTYAIGKRGSA